jgi:hypothetical protein
MVFEAIKKLSLVIFTNDVSQFHRKACIVEA